MPRRPTDRSTQPVPVNEINRVCEALDHAYSLAVELADEAIIDFRHVEDLAEAYGLVRDWLARE